MTGILEKHAAALAAAAVRYTGAEPFGERASEALKSGECLSENEFQPFKAVFTAFGGIINEKGGITAAIDGKSGAGKSTLARALNMVWGGNIFHVDDYFLPAVRRTPAGEPNFDVKRFETEAGEIINAGRKGFLRRFDCKSQSLCPPKEMFPKAINAIEGAYSFYAERFINFDLKIFMDITADRQLERIEARAGAPAAAAFKERWIPLENAYFDRYETMERANIVVRVG